MIIGDGKFGKYEPGLHVDFLSNEKYWKNRGYKMVPVYTTPPAAQRQPLTDEAIWRQYQALWPFHPAEEPRLAADMVTFVRAIEAAHGIKEKNT
jgi:hypothetical protein